MSLTSTPRSRPATWIKGEPVAKGFAPDRRQLATFERWPGYIAVTLIGIGGFIGLLIASNTFPEYAKPLRITALIWFAWFSVIRLATARRP